jgi:hypothetical protein
MFSKRLNAATVGKHERCQRSEGERKLGELLLKSCKLNITTKASAQSCVTLTCPKPH